MQRPPADTRQEMYENLQERRLIWATLELEDQSTRRVESNTICRRLDVRHHSTPDTDSRQKGPIESGRVVSTPEDSPEVLVLPRQPRATDASRLVFMISSWILNLMSSWPVVIFAWLWFLWPFVLRADFYDQLYMQRTQVCLRQSRVTSCTFRRLVPIARALSQPCEKARARAAWMTGHYTTGKCRRSIHVIQNAKHSYSALFRGALLIDRISSKPWTWCARVELFVEHVLASF